MTIALVETDAYDQWIDTNAYSAFDGLSKLGVEVRTYTFAQLRAETVDAEPQDLFVGHVRSVRERLRQLGKCPRACLSTPPELVSYLARQEWTQPLLLIREQLLRQGDAWDPIFIKPYEAHKQFNGRVITSLTDIADLGTLPDETMIWCQGVVDWITEWRAYVLEGRVIKLCHYAGEPLYFPDLMLLSEILEHFPDPPIAYGIDLGWIHTYPWTAEPALVELNDGFALGNYGLDSVTYAQFLQARWDEIITKGSL